MARSGYQNWRFDPYPHLREALAPEYAELDPEQIEALIEQTFGPGLSAEQYEEIFGAITKAASSVGRAVGGVARDVGRTATAAGREVGRVAQKAAPVVTSALPGIAQGALSGAALGPVGMVAGAVLGGTSSALAKHGKGALRGIGKAVNTGVGLAGMLTPGGAIGRGLLGAVTGGGGLGGLARAGVNALGGGGAGAFGQIAHKALGGSGGAGGIGQIAQTTLGALAGGDQPGGLSRGSPAAGQLLHLIGQRPEVAKALQSMMLSPIGRQSIPVSGQQVPVAAFTNLIGQLAGLAQAEYQAALGPQSETVPEYLHESTGAYRCDPADPMQRAEVLWNLLQDVEPEADEHLDEQLYMALAKALLAEQAEADEAAFYDALELAELDADFEEVD
ncbi:hypothetical protein [Cupriavidus oxalaticus]|uniref:Uncharacterized protein n=1 Tax=Cupriavidus oxalaticus TaxID=96344 RepID=A0A4P7LH56_9BURK|nr:hypothetical protein [Cupriavidus oxalaticus]QBY55460.1 hypothetical protein E0W60_30960 [Cupriavidus oxalaticus]